jgi:hypothetical protein
MRDFDLRREARTEGGVDEQAGISPIHGGAEDRDFTRGGSAVALKRDAQRTPRKDDAEARHKAEIDRLRAVVAEITAENLELKKKI